MTSAILRFPGERLAVFTSSLGASDTSSQLVVGTEGRLELEPAYGYTEELEHKLTIDKKTSEKKYSVTGQFAAEIDYFSRCVQEGTDPEPSGEEGLADVRVIDAIYRSAMIKQPVSLAPFTRASRPSLKQEIHRKPSSKVEPFHASAPTRA